MGDSLIILFASIVYIFLPLAFIIRSIRSVIFHIYIWQLKEYRVDRMLAYLKTQQGKRWVLNKVSLAKWIFLLSWIPILINPQITTSTVSGFVGLVLFGLLSYGLPILVYLTEGLKDIFSLSLGKWKFSVWTAKTILVFTISITFLLYFIWSNYHWNDERSYLAYLLIDKLTGTFIGSLIILFSLPSWIYKKYLVYKAKKVILENKKLKIIGITGSYGKSSTKEYLAHILSTKYTVLKTPENINTEIGVAQTILDELKPDHEIFVVEMGAYKKGEIKAICDLVHPTIGIVTGINEQHIELFGSIENTMKAKYELIESLPKDGVAIINGNNEKCLVMGEWGKRDGKKVSIYKVQNEKTGSSPFAKGGMTGYMANTIKTTKDGLEFDMSFDGKPVHTSAKLFGKHNVENLLAAAVAAHTLGMSSKDIASAIQSIIPHDKNMKKIILPSGASAIDDTYNSNPDSVRAILDYMKLYKGKKVLVLMPLIELGEQAEDIHRRLGGEIAGVCDHLIVTNTNYSEAIKEGIGTNTKMQLDIASGVQAAELLKKYNDKEDIIGFEGREAGTILKFI